MPNDAPVQLLWTGGWDSTYRLLALLLHLRLPVAPIYIYDAKRASAPVEMKTMDGLREAIVQAYPHARALLQPTTVANLEDIAPDADIDRAFDRVLKRVRIGDQYAFLARYCKQHGLDGVELSVENAPRGAHAALDAAMELVASPAGPTYRMRDDADEDLRKVFGPFSCPIFMTRKEDMSAAVVRNGWQPLMGMTWFCHKPSRNMTPCGFCNPCQYVLQQGMGHRIPRSRRTLSRLYSFTLMPLRARTRQLLRRMRAQT